MYKVLEHTRHTSKSIGLVSTQLRAEDSYPIERPAVLELHQRPGAIPGTQTAERPSEQRSDHFVCKTANNIPDGVGGTPLMGSAGRWGKQFDGGNKVIMPESLLDNRWHGVQQTARRVAA